MSCCNTIYIVENSIFQLNEKKYEILLLRKKWPLYRKIQYYTR